MTQRTSRRDILIGAGALAATGSLPAFIRAALAQDKGKGSVASLLKALTPVALNIPPVRFKIGQATCAGPWGEARLLRFDNVALPYRVTSANKLGLIEMSASKPFVQLGVGRPDAITWSSPGVSFGQGLKLEQWSQATARKLRVAIQSDRHKVRALMQLRATLLSSYPVYLAATNTTSVPETVMALERTGNGMTQSTCAREEREVIINRTEREITEIWSSAQAQYDQCFDRETSGAKDLACSYLPRGEPRNLCAITVCTAKTFVAVLVDTIESVRTVAEAVVMEVVVCTIPAVKNAMLNTWSLVDRGPPGFGKIARLVTATAQDKQAALLFLQDAAAALGPLARELIGSRWDVQQKQAQQLADGSEALLFDVKIFMKSSAADAMNASAAAAEFAATQAILITLLASVSAGFAVAAAAWGVIVPVPLVAAAAGLSAGGTAIVAAALAMVILVFAHAAVIAAQIEIAKQAGDLADGEVQIRHTTLMIEQVRQELEYLRNQGDAVHQAAQNLFQPPAVVG